MTKIKCPECGGELIKKKYFWDRTKSKYYCVDCDYYKTYDKWGLKMECAGDRIITKRKLP